MIVVTMTPQSSSVSGSPDPDSRGSISRTILAGDDTWLLPRHEAACLCGGSLLPSHVGFLVHWTQWGDPQSATGSRTACTPCRGSARGSLAIRVPRVSSSSAIDWSRKVHIILKGPAEYHRQFLLLKASLIARDDALDDRGPVSRLHLSVSCVSCASDRLRMCVNIQPRVRKNDRWERWAGNNDRLTALRYQTAALWGTISFEIGESILEMSSIWYATARRRTRVEKLQISIYYT